MSLRWLLLAGLVILCRGFAAVGGGCEDADDTTVMQAAREMGRGDVMSCSDVAIQGHCSHPQAKEGCCKTCNRGRLLGGQPSCQGAGSRSFRSENCGVGDCSQTGKDEPPCEPYGPCCDHEGYKCVHRYCNYSHGSFTCTDWYGCNFIDHPSPPPPPPPLPPPLEVVKPHIVASTQSCPLGQSCSPITWTELNDIVVDEGTCDPNPNPTGTVTKVCPLGSLELAPSGDISDSRPTLYKGNLACVAPKDGTQCDFRGKDGTPDYTPCSVSYTCSNAHRPLKACPRGTWSCVAYNGEDADGPDWVLKHSTVGSDPRIVGSDPRTVGSDRAAVPCWFPSLSPLGLELQGRKTKPSARANLLEQCKHPPFVFAYDDPGPVSRTPDRPGVLPSTPTTFSCLKTAGDDETDTAPPEYSTFPETDIATPCDPAGGDTSLGSCNDDDDCQAKCDNDDNCLGYSVEAVTMQRAVTVNIGSSSSYAPDSSVLADTNVVGDCSSAPGGNSDLGVCSSQADCEAQCNSIPECLGYVDMSSKSLGYMLKKYVGPGRCLEARTGFVLHTMSVQSFTLKKYLGPACVEHNPAARIRAKPAAVKPKRGFLIDETLGTLEEWDRQCGETFWSQGTYDWTPLLDGSVQCRADLNECEMHWWCPCDDKGTFQPCEYLLFFAYHAQKALATYPATTGGAEWVARLSSAVRILESLGQELLSPDPIGTTGSSSAGSRSLLFAPLPDDGSCDNSFAPTCEQVRGFGLCDMHAAAQACPDTCSTTLDTSGHHLHEENITMQPIDYTTPVLDPEVKAIVCGVCRGDPDLACCHNHPHRARARRLTQSSCELAAANSRTRCGAAAAATITGLTSLSRRYLRNAIERANAASTNTSAMRAVSALSYTFLTDEVQAHVDEVKGLKDEFSKDSDVKWILDAITGLYTAGQAKVAGGNSVLAAREAQLDKQLQWALTVVETAQKGMEETDKKMKEKLEKLQAEVEAHMVAQLISGIFSMLFSFAEMFVNPMGLVSAGKKAADFAKDLQTSGKQVYKSLKEGSTAFKVLAKIETFSATIQKAVIFFTVAEKIIDVAGGVLGCTGVSSVIGKLTKSPISEICSKSKGIAGLNQRFAVADQGGKVQKIIEKTKTDLGSEPRQEDLDEAADKLMEDVSKMSDGWWEEQGDGMRTSVNVFLTGEVGGTSAAGLAQDYRDMVGTKTQYGKDFTAALETIVTVFQEMAMIAVQKRANENTMGVINLMGNKLESKKLFAEWQKQLLAMQITETVVTLQDTLRAACHSLAYQASEQYFKCLADETLSNNDFRTLCSSFEDGVTPIYEPFSPRPFSPEANEMAAEEYYERVLADLGYDSFKPLQLAVEKELWGSQTTQQVQIEIKEFETPEPNTTMVDTVFTDLLPCDMAENEAFVAAGNLSCIDKDALPLPPDSTLGCCRTNGTATTVESLADVTEFPSTPYATSAEWAEFKRTGRLSFRLGHDSFPVLMDGYCGLFLKGVMVYLNSPSTPITTKEGDRVSITLEPAAIVRQRYKDGDGNFTEVEFASGADKFAIFPINRFEYLPGKAPACQNEQYGVKAKVFSAQTDLCAREEALPANTCPAEYCIDSELATGNLAQYFGRKPDFSSMLNSPFNQAAMYTTWTVSASSFSTSSANGLDLSGVESVHLQLYYIGKSCGAPGSTPTCSFPMSG